MYRAPRTRRVDGYAIGGIAFNSFEVESAARIAYADSLNRALLDVRASTSAVARGEVVTWYDLNSRFGLMAVIDYIVARPNIDIVTDAGIEDAAADSRLAQIPGTRRLQHLLASPESIVRRDGNGRIWH